MAVDPKQLRGLASAIPGLNEQATKQAQAARQVQMQQQLGQAPAQAGPAAAQQMAAQQAQQRGQIAAAGQQQTQQMLGQVGQMGLQAQQAQQQQKLGQAQMAQQEQLAAKGQAQTLELSRKEQESRKQVLDMDLKSAQRVQQAGMDYDNNLQMLSIQQRKDLARIGRDVKQKIFDSRMTFDKDEMGRKFTNQRQLADYVASNALSNQQLNDRMQKAQQASARNIQLMKIAQSAVMRELRQEAKKAEAAKDFTHQKELAKLSARLKKKIADEEAKAKNNSAIWGAVGSVVGGAVGFVATGGNPLGAMAGAKIGGGLGTAGAGAYTSAKT